MGKNHTKIQKITETIINLDAYAEIIDSESLIEKYKNDSDFKRNLKAFKEVHPAHNLIGFFKFRPDQVLDMVSKDTQIRAKDKTSSDIKRLQFQIEADGEQKTAIVAGYNRNSNKLSILDGNHRTHAIHEADDDIIENIIAYVIDISDHDIDMSFTQLKCNNHRASKPNVKEDYMNIMTQFNEKIEGGHVNKNDKQILLYKTKVYDLIKHNQDNSKRDLTAEGNAIEKFWTKDLPNSLRLNPGFTKKTWKNFAEKFFDEIKFDLKKITGFKEYVTDYWAIDDQKLRCGDIRGDVGYVYGEANAIRKQINILETKRFGDIDQKNATNKLRVNTIVYDNEVVEKTDSINQLIRSRQKNLNDFKCRNKHGSPHIVIQSVHFPNQRRGKIYDNSETYHWNDENKDFVKE
jgi:hypothetical protein